MPSVSYAMWKLPDPLSLQTQDFCVVKNTFLDFRDETPSYAADMREPRSRSEPPLRLNAAATLVQTGDGGSWSRDATPQLGFARSVTEPMPGHSNHHVAPCRAKLEPVGNANLGANACHNESIPAYDTTPSKERMETPDCFPAWQQHYAGFDDFGGVLSGTCDDHSNLVDNMGSQPYQKGSCDNSAHEWNSFSMDKVLRFPAHAHFNLHHSNAGNDQPCSTALCNFKHERVSLHETTSSAHSDRWGPKTTTVMIRQIPRWLTQQMLVAEVENQGFHDCFNFLYLPWERKRNHNMGYAFINFVQAKGAIAFKEVFDGLYLNSEMEMRSKPLRVHPAAVQGYQANHQHFMRTKIGRSQNVNSPIFLDRHTMEQIHETPPAAGTKKRMLGQWQYPDNDRKYHQANVLQPQSFANGFVLGELPAEPALVQKHSTNNLRSCQSRAPAPSINYRWSGVQNVLFKENVEQHADNGKSQQHRGGNNEKDVDDLAAALGITVLCLSCGKPCGSQRLSFCHCCSQQFGMEEEQSTC